MVYISIDSNRIMQQTISWGEWGAGGLFSVAKFSRNYNERKWKINKTENRFS